MADSEVSWAEQSDFSFLPYPTSLPQPLEFIGVLLSDSINLTIYISKYILHSLFVLVYVYLY